MIREMDVRRRSSRLSFRLAVQRALAVLHSRKAEIENVIWYLESQVRCHKRSGRSKTPLRVRGFSEGGSR